MTLPKNSSLLLEFLILFGGVPLLILYFRMRILMVAVLWLGAFAIHLLLKYHHEIPHVEEMNWSGFRAGIKTVLIRLGVISALLAAVVYYFEPDLFLSFPRERPQFWLIVMILYPILSVWPQELIYRSFLFYRYRPLFGADVGYIAASSVAFAYAHLMFLNWLAPAMTLVGGVLFATSYRTRNSLALSCVEHALYGCLIFTLGIGRYFFTGAAWHQY